MAGALEAFAYRDIDTLSRLEEELEEVFLVIANAGKSEDKTYIKQVQNRIKRKYEPFVIKRRGILDVLDSSEGMGKALSCIVHAYDELMNILEPFDDSEDVEERAKNALYENILFPENMEECLEEESNEN